MNFLVNDTGILGKREPEFAHRSLTYDLSITSSVPNVGTEVKLEGFNLNGVIRSITVSISHSQIVKKMLIFGK